MRLNSAVQTDSVCNRGSSLSFLHLITNSLYCVFFFLFYPEREIRRRPWLVGASRKFTGSQPLTKMLTLIFINLFIILCPSESNILTTFQFLGLKKVAEMFATTLTKFNQMFYFKSGNQRYLSLCLSPFVIL